MSVAQTASLFPPLHLAIRLAGWSLYTLAVLALLSANARAGEAVRRADPRGDPLPPGVIARLGTLRFRGVRGCLAFSPDGKLLAAATGSTGERVTLWDMTTEREVRQIAVSATVTSLAFSPDGKRLACSTNRCQVFEAASGKELFAVEGGQGAFSGDGKKLVTADSFATDPRGHVWDAATGRLLRHWPGQKGLNGLLLSVGSQTLAVLDGTRPTEVEIHDLDTGKKIRSLRRAARGKPNPGLPDGWRFVTLARDGKTLAAVNKPVGAFNDIAVELLDVESGKTVARWRGDVPARCAFAPDGRRLAWTGYGEQGGGLRLWVGQGDGKSGMRVVSEPAYNTEPPCFSPDGKVVALLTDAFTVSLRDTATAKQIRPSDAHENPVTLLVLTPDGQHVLSGAGADLFAWETRSGRLLRRPLGPLVGREFIEHMLPDGRLLTNDPDGALVRVRDMLTRRVDQRIEASRPAFGPPVAVPAPAGRYAAVHQRDGSAAVLDLRTGRCKYRLDASEAHQGMKLSDDGDVLVWYNGAGGKPWHGSRDGKVNVRVRRQTSAKTFVPRDLPNDDRWVRGFAYHRCLSSDGRWLIIPTEEGCLRRWDLTAGEERMPLTKTFWSIEELHWSPDGRLLAALGSASQPTVGRRWWRLLEMRVWDVAAGTRLKHLTRPETPILVRFSPDSRTMLTTDQQGVIHLWEVATGKERGRLQGHLLGLIGALALSADGRLLVSGGGDSQVLVWDLTGRMPDGQWRTARHPPEQLRAAWQALAADDAKAAYAALWRLAADPEGAVALLRQWLRPAARPEPAEVKRLIAELDSGDFARRQHASRELETLTEAAAPQLREALARKPSLEARRRMEALLESLDRPPADEPLRTLRAIEVLEDIGTAEARRLLRELAGGFEDARLTQQAKAALMRLSRR